MEVNKCECHQGSLRRKEVVKALLDFATDAIQLSGGDPTLATMKKVLQLACRKAHELEQESNPNQ